MLTSGQGHDRRREELWPVQRLLSRPVLCQLPRSRSASGCRSCERKVAWV